MKLKPVLFSLLVAIPGLAQIPVPQINLTGNIGCQGFPCVNSGTLSMTDANHNMTAQETSAFSIKVISSVPLTATRNLVAPVGRFPFTIENSTTGGHSIQIIGASGTGVTIANGTTVSVWNDDTNFVSVGVGGGGSPVGPTNAMQTNGGGGTFGDSGCTATGGAITCPGGGGVGGYFDATEGTAGSLVPTAGHDIFYADATGHCFQYSHNGVAFSCFGSGALSGQTINYIPLATSATASTLSSQFFEISGRDGVTNPFDVWVYDPNNVAVYGGASAIGHLLAVHQSYLPGDSGDPFMSSNAAYAAFYDWYPGFSYGNSATINQGWYLPSAHQIHVESYSDGIHSALPIKGFYASGGDVNIFDMEMNVRGSRITPSDEGVIGDRQRLTETAEDTATVVAGGSGATTIQLTSNTHGDGIGLDSPMLDTTLGTSGTVTYVSTTAGNWIQMTTSFAVPSGGTTGTLASDCNSPRVAPNPTYKLSANVVTCSVNTGTTLNVGDLLDLVGPDRNEVVKLTAVGTPSSGVQSITATMYFSHTSGTTYYANGAVGNYLVLTGAYYTASGWKYAEQVYGSSGTNTVFVGHKGPNSWESFYTGLTGVNATMYPGGDLVGVLNPDNGLPDGGKVVIMPPPSAAFAAGDSVLITNNISAAYSSINHAMNIRNPWAYNIANQFFNTTEGGGLSGANGWLEVGNDVASSSYRGAGGSYFAPWAFAFLGPTRNGIALNHPPVATNGDGVDGLQNCGGYLLCIANAPYAGQADREGIFTQGDQNSTFWYDHAAQKFHLDTLNGVDIVVGGLTLNGVPVCQQNGTNCPASGGTVTGSGTTGFIPKFTGSTAIGNSACDDGITTGGWFTCSEPIQSPAFISTQGAKFIDAGGGYINLALSGDTTGGGLNGVAAGNVGTGDPNQYWNVPSGGIEYHQVAQTAITALQSGGYNLGSGKLLGWSSTSTATATADTGLSRDSAGVVDVGNGTAGNASGTLKAANLGASSLTNARCVTVAGGLLSSSSLDCNAITQLTSVSWSVQPTLFATATMLGAVYLAPYTSTSTLRMTARLAGTISCTVAPQIELMDLGTSETTVYGSATTIQSLATGTADGVYTTTVAGANLTSGHYYGIGFSSGTCVTPPTFDISELALW